VQGNERRLILRHANFVRVEQQGRGLAWPGTVKEVRTMRKNMKMSHANTVRAEQQGRGLGLERCKEMRDDA
jgi:hypothetical protein